MNRVSIVICTYNRAESLRETIRCLRHQRYDQFEVIVVNGPSTDHTADVIAEFDGLIRAEVCPLPNLSVSRNIGIRAAAGDIVAFIDDDALPEFDWLQQALPAFADDDVGGVGGIVFDHSGMALQYRYSAANRFGEATSSVDRPYDDFSVPGSFLFPYLQGTNALFRRSALEEIGGFDEVYDYYLDETDVCCRLVDAGYVLRQLHHAPVHHKFLPSGIRTPERVVTNWFPIIKNQTYFAFRHALGARPEVEVFDHCRASIDRWCTDARFHQDAGRLPPGTVERVLQIGGEAMKRGMELGLERHWLRHERMAPPSAAFQRFPVIDSSRRRCVAMITGDYPPRSTGGIARFLGDAAPSLAERGHEIRVVTRAEQQHGTVDLEDGVWVHRIVTPPVAAGEGVAPEALPHINAFVTAAAAELQRIGTWRTIDVAYGPAWDVDVIAALRTTPLPVVPMLATPVAVAAHHAGDLGDPQTAANLAGLMRDERELFRAAHLVHSISAAVLDTVEHEYDVEIRPTRSAVAAIGLRDHRPETPAKRAAGPTRVLFVGRLETRKGIDDLLTAIELLAPRHDDVVWQIAGSETRPRNQASHEAIFRHRNRTAPWLDRVTFLGGVDDDELHELYEGADLVVLPSRYESFGLVMVEAMMHGRAQVSCSIGGITEVVRHKVDGLLVPPADPDALAAAIDDLLVHPQRRRTMGKAGRARFEEEFTIEAATSRLDAVLTRLSVTPAGHTGVTAIDPGAKLVASGGHEALWVERRTRVVIAPPADATARRTAAINASAGAQVVLRSRASLATTVDLREGWNAVPIPSIGDDTVITWRSGDVIFAGLVTVGAGVVTRIAIVTGICVADDAISAAVASQAAMLHDLDGIESVDVFAQLCTRTLPCDSHTVSSSWELLCHERFQRADIAIFHWGIHFDLFDALAIMRGRVEGASGPLPVVHFHNCTPRELVDEDHHVTIDRSIAQGQLVAGGDVAVWTFSPFNEATLLGWGVRPEQIEFVPFAVEPPRPLTSRRRSGHVALACVGRMVPAKGQHVVVEAIAALPEDLQRKVSLRIAGNALFSSAEYVASLDDLITRTGLRDVVQLVGQPDDEGLWRLYEATDVLVAPSQHEGLCVPVLEAYHAGCRVIGSDAGNLPFIVQPPDPVFPVNDSRALARAIEQVAIDVLAGTRVDRTPVSELLDRYSSAGARRRHVGAIESLMARATDDTRRARVS